MEKKMRRREVRRCGSRGDEETGRAGKKMMMRKKRR
jgi:hypothetical protein